MIDGLCEVGGDLHLAALQIPSHPTKKLED